MLVTLAAMLGQIGLPGGGFGFSYHYASGGAPSADAPVLTGITDGGKAKAGAAWLTESGAASIPVARVVDMLLNPGKEFDFNGVKAKYPDVKMAYWVGGNPFVHHQDRNRMVAAWKKLETFIVQDFQWTPTARFADIVLPATTSYERNDIEASATTRRSAILAMKKVIDPVFESRNDYDIFAAISERARQGQGVHRRQERDGLDPVVLRRGADPGEGEEDRRCRSSTRSGTGRAWSSSRSPAARASCATPSSARIRCSTARHAVGQDRDLLEEHREDGLRRLRAASDVV